MCISWVRVKVRAGNAGLRARSMSDAAQHGPTELAPGAYFRTHGLELFALQPYNIFRTHLLVYMYRMTCRALCHACKAISPPLRPT
jgi:hypothetical protein